MVNHLKTVVAKQNLDVKLLLKLGMHGRNAFQNLLIKELKEKHHTTLTNLGTCSLHSANNGFSKLVKELDDIVELDQMAIDFHFFLNIQLVEEKILQKYQKQLAYYQGISRNSALLDR